jgi:RNA polymerase sigma-70 factor (ECF subfamily)
VNKNDFVEKVMTAEATLYHISKSILKNDCDCADAVQETITKAYSKLHSLRDERFFRTWLCRILINECYRICHTNKRVVPLEDYMDIENPPQQQNELGLFNAIMELKTDLRLVIVLHYIEGFQTTEVAEILKIPEGTVKSRLWRARTVLKSILGEKEVLIHEQI